MQEMNLIKDIITNIEILINNNKIDEAEIIVNEISELRKVDDVILGLKGVIAILRNELDSATKYLLEAYEINKFNFDILYNLAYVYEMKEEHEIALYYYSLAIEDVFDENMKKQIEGRILEIKSIKPNIVAKRKKKIVFFDKGGDSFLKDIIENLGEEYDVKKIAVTEYSQIDEGMEWADICWFEWCDELIEYGSKSRFAETKKIMCRLHRYEAFTQYPSKVEWNNVDKLILVTPHIEGILKLSDNAISEKVDIVTIKNGVNIEKYKLKKRSIGFDIAYVGYIHSRKNPMMILQIINKLVKKNSKYKLHIAGVFQEPLIKLYWDYQVKQMGLKDNIIFYGWVDDINKWLDNKQYVLATTIHESFGYGIAEAMARGIKPVIHNFLSADEIWDNKYLYNTVDEAVDMIMSNEYESSIYREYIEKNYSLEKQIDVIRETVEDMYNYNEEKIHIIKDLEEFIPYTKEFIDKFKFLDCKVKNSKIEKIFKNKLLIEFIIENNCGSNLLVSGVVYNILEEKITLPEVIEKSKNKEKIIILVNDILIGNINFSDRILGIINDDNLRKDIEENSLAYTWERGIPATQFMPVNGLRRIAYRYKFIRNFINENSLVLEAPCGFGYGAAYMSKYAKEIQAIDIADSSLEFASSVYDIKNIEWKKDDVTKLSYENQTFDVYVSYEVLEHLEEKSIDKYLREAKRVLKSGGKFIISTPNYENRKHVNNPFHLKEYTEVEFKKILSKYFNDIKYYSTEDYKINDGIGEKSINMIAVCNKR